MKYTILTQPLPEADELWLKTAANSEFFDPRIARAQLFQQLPRDFEPTNIDRRFYANDKLTVIGLRRFKPESIVLKNMQSVAISIRNKLLAAPGTESLDVNILCDELNISRINMQDAIAMLQNVGQFFSGLAHSKGSNYVEKVYFSGPSGYDGPLKFSTVDEALEQFYIIQSFHSRLRSGNRTTVKDEVDGDFVVGSKRSSGHGLGLKKNTAFVIMPIDPKRPELMDILDAIKEVSASFGITAYRADEIEHQDVITNVVLEGIRQSEFLIADLSHERPNVYYEIGYAHALDKKPILYRRVGTNLHFDLSVHNVPEYANARELRELLKKRFEAILGRAAT